MIEKRDSRRVKLRVRVSLTVEGKARIAFTTNVSKTGFAITSVHTYAPGTPVQARFQLPEGEVATEAVVVWARMRRGLEAMVEHNALGLRFTATPPEAYDRHVSTALASAHIAASPVVDPPAKPLAAGTLRPGSGAMATAIAAGSKLGLATPPTPPPAAAPPAPAPAAAAVPTPAPAGAAPTRGSALRIATIAEQIAALDLVSTPGGLALSLPRALELMEEAARQAASSLPGADGGLTLVSAELNLGAVPVQPGTAVAAVAMLLREATPSTKAIFVTEVRDAARALAHGRLTFELARSR